MYHVSYFVLLSFEEDNLPRKDCTTRSEGIRSVLRLAYVKAFNSMESMSAITWLISMGSSVLFYMAQIAIAKISRSG